MKLYGSGKSRSFRVLWALEEAGLAYDYIPVKFASKAQNGTDSSAYRALNPQGKIPTLVDDGMVITESVAIMNYIARVSELDSLMPRADLKLLARYDEICSFIVTELEQPLWTNGKHRFALPPEQRREDVLPVTYWEFHKAQNALLHFFDGDGFVVGNEFTMADILLAHTITWAENFKFEVQKRFLNYRDRMWQRPACQYALNKLAQMEPKKE